METHNTREGIEEKLVKHLVDRFCGWHLPKDFHPDGGIMFMDVYDNGTEQGGKFEPTGTNLFTAEQAKEMFRFLLEHENGTPILAEILHQELQKAREKLLSIAANAIEENTAFYEQKYGGNYKQCGRDIKFSIAQALDRSGLDQHTNITSE